MNNDQVVNGLDNELEIDNDLGHKLCTKLWLEALTSNGNSNDGSVHTLTSYTYLLAASSAGFLYSIEINDEGKRDGVCLDDCETTRDNFVTTCFVRGILHRYQSGTKRVVIPHLY